MEIKTYNPKHPVLKKYIEYYYKTVLEDHSFFAYPHYNLPVSIISKAESKVINNKVVVSQKSKSNLQSFTYNKFAKPIHIELNGKCNVFCLVFKPYGLVQFLPNSINLNSQKNILIINLFDNLLEYSPNFSELNINDKINKIESYLLSIFQEKEDSEIVIKAISIIKKQDKLSIKEIAELCNCHQKKLYRLFNKLCGDSPMVFKKIIQFRKALEKIKVTNSSFKLTNVALDSNYYDQSAFNNAFKKLTGEKPSQFFKETEIYTPENIYFKEVKKVNV
ncbi:hypothetical protein CXF68_03900 [Tenacibaculum sp. Bg11-29]|uniref:helix-turn-helix domain-containing protein n=1 Tax=Tenacibaculum sp. Bg11-29 TaxID=2058306 RepID=UPI000C34B0B7|nr:AraC family transcriptional regulator [Tenacibaculum sp. Bg11-29]PKH49896.1 hypothetical protein CXF68_03900 [Tenacibaculum sp. Bg11-29]